MITLGHDTTVITVRFYLEVMICARGERQIFKIYL
jgi:hypothetical protein